MTGTLINDLRQTARQLSTAPGFTAVALLAFALGVGAITAVFTIVNAVLVRPLPFERADELYRVAKKSPAGADQWLSVPEFSRWQRESRPGDIVAGFTPMDFNLRGAHPESLIVVWASQDFLRIFGTAPSVGRDFTEADFHAGADRAALISHQLWQRRFDGDPAVVGSQVDLEGPGFLADSSGPYTIIGVLPDDFWLFYSRTDFVIPMRASVAQANDPNRRLVAAVVARARGVNPGAVRADLTRISEQFAREHASGHAPPSIVVEPLQQWHFGDMRQPLRLVMGTALLVALVASLNVALLLIARTMHRRRELAIRLAIGAQRGRIVGLLLTEGLLLACTGGLLGVLLAEAAMRVAGSLVPSHLISRLPGGLDSLALEPRVILVAIVASIVAGLFAGAGGVVVLQGRRAAEILRNGGASVQSSRRPVLQAALVVAQTAVAVVLLVTGALLMQSLLRMQAVDLGIQPREGLVVWLNLNQSRYGVDEERVRFYDSIFERLADEPDVMHASGVDLPFTLEWQTARFATGSTAEAQPDRWPEALARAATPTYFHRHGIRLVQGRGFTEQDHARTQPVAIVSQAFAGRHWPGSSPIGEPLRIRRGQAPPMTSTIVGVVSDIRSAPHGEPQPIVYRPVRQAPPPWLYVTVEGDTTRADLLSALRRAVWAVDPEQPLDGPSGPWTLEGWISERTEQPRLIAILGNTLAAVALLLSTMSLCGLLSYSVARRTPEIGVRMALGATPAHVMRQIGRLTLTLTTCGVVVGLAMSAALGRFLESLLFGIAPLDPGTFGAAALVFLAVAAAGAWVPIRRAMSVSPLVALRSE